MKTDNLLTLLFFTIGCLNFLAECQGQDQGLGKAMEAIQQVQRIMEGSRPSGPPPMGAPGNSDPMKEIDKILGSIDQAPLLTSPRGLELLHMVHRIQIMSLTRQGKTAEARGNAQDLIKKIDSAKTISAEDRIPFRARAMLELQDVSFADRDWSGLVKLRNQFEQAFPLMVKTPSGVAALGNVGVQLVRYSALSGNRDKFEEMPIKIMNLLRSADCVSTVERETLAGNIIDQVLDFSESLADPNAMSSPTPSPSPLPTSTGGKKVNPIVSRWIEDAKQSWLLLRDQKEVAAKMLSAQLIGHCASSDPKESSRIAHWKEFHAWLSRDNGSSFGMPSIASAYIEANIRYLNSLERGPFASHLLRVQSFLDETAELPGCAPSVTMVRSQLEQGIKQRKNVLFRPLVGEPSPSIPYRSIEDGKLGSLNSFRGKVVVVEFWNTHCGPCLASFEHLSRLFEKHREKGLVVIGCTFAEAEGDRSPVQKNLEATLAELREFLSKRKVSYPMVLATDLKVLQDFGINAMPTLFVIDRQGKIIAHAEGFDEFTSAKTQNILLEALNR